MRRWLPASVVFSLTIVLAVVARAAEPRAQLSVVTDRPDALYSVGEKVQFQVTLKKANRAVTEGEIGYIIDKDGMPPVKQGRLKAAGGPLVVEGSLGEPGFLRCRVFYPAGSKQMITATAGAGIDPLGIKPSLGVPADFDAFWAAQKARLEAVPMKPALTPVKSPIAEIECFDVQIPCVPPRPVSGYFARPAGAAPKSLPAILHVQGAGVRSSNLGSAAGWAKQYQALSMDINAHGIPNGKPEQYYKDLSAGLLNDYRAVGREDREKCYFLGMFLRMQRALDFLTGQPQWDGKILIVEGSSQGGGQSLAAAGLDPRVTMIAAGVPAICDHSGKVVGRINGWPKLVPDKDGKPDPQILQVARYFDCMNFATRARAEAILSVGFIDGTCPPSSVYAAYNNLPGKKQIVNKPLMTHASPPDVRDAFAKAISEYLARAKVGKRG